MRHLQRAVPPVRLRWCLVWALAFLVLTLHIAAATDTIIAVKSLNVEPYTVAFQELQAALVRSGRAVEVQEYLLNESGEGQDGLLAEINARRPALILTFGSAATAWIQKQVKDVPVVFCMVLNPVASGLVPSMESSGTNVTGTSLDIPARLQFETLKAVAPSIKTVGVFYNPQETREVVQRAAKDAADVGLELLAIPIHAAEQLPDSFDRHKKDMDALWSVADRTVFASDRAIEFLIRRTQAYRIPFIGLSPAFVKGGALLALSADYRDIGAQCGEQVAQILAGRDPAALPITVPRKVTVYLNLNVAKALGLAIPPRTMEGAVVLR